MTSISACEKFASCCLWMDCRYRSLPLTVCEKLKQPLYLIQLECSKVLMLSFKSIAEQYHLLRGLGVVWESSAENFSGLVQTCRINVCLSLIYRASTDLDGQGSRLETITCVKPYHHLEGLGSALPSLISNRNRCFNQIQTESDKLAWMGGNTSALYWLLCCYACIVRFVFASFDNE